MRNLLIILLCLLSVNLLAQDAPSIIPKSKVIKKDTASQTDLLDIFKATFKFKPQKIKPEKGKKLYFSFLPISTTVPGGDGRALVTSTTAGIYLGPRRTTSLSSFTFAPYFNFKGRFGLPLRNSIWFPNNTWTIQGDTRFLVYPQYTWGLGSTPVYANRTLVDYKYIRFYQSMLKRIKPYLFAGVGYNLDYRFNIKSDDTAVNLKAFTGGYRYGTEGNSFSSGISINLLYDTRSNNNSINPLPGFYTNIIYRVNPEFLGSNDNWHSLYVDVRKYIALSPDIVNRQNTLAFWTYLWTALNNKTPYLDLPSIGWDPYNKSGRGVDQNRYRGNTLYYAEAEYRRDITSDGLFGFVLFTNVTTVSGDGKFLQSWHPAVGTGVRIKFNKASNTNIGVDFGISKGYRGVFFSLGEAF